MTRKRSIPALHYASRHVPGPGSREGAPVMRREWGWSCHAGNGEIVASGWGLDTKAEARLSARRAALALTEAILREDRARG